ncbi:hypothetical protein LLEC1_01228 [Akanthomyces lecanii]|uniref:Alpha/beta hydrolase fold-3 domain-containing protein n=1 Tax=Cordyceps confragosa TaxID=2714763 RepID=A0A179I5K8_CORDF|nr:hypothetical protein LLEC1_01228 [Akanthomyces lecanii]
MTHNVFNGLRILFRPLLVGLFNTTISWSMRWRVLLLQQFVFLTYTIPAAPYLFSRPFVTEYLPVFPNRSVRTLVFKRNGKGTGRKLRPLHIDIHGGAFIGGIAEQDARICEMWANETGAIVLSITYRFAPEHVFPAAIDDVDATVQWIKDNAESRWGADPTLLTISGASAGGNMAVASAQQAKCHGASPTAYKGIITAYGVYELRLSPWQKPVPEKMPKSDPTSFLQPLFDSYAAPIRAKHVEDPRLSPILAKRETLPNRVLMVIAEIDILLEEQTQFAKRINEEDQRAGWLGKPRIETMFAPEGFHGWLELPDSIVKKELKTPYWTRCVDFLKEIHQSEGWTWDTQR